MEPARRHPWPADTRQAIAIQERWRALVIREDRLGPVRRVVGVDVAFEAQRTVTRAAAVVLDVPSLALREGVVARRPTRFPYVPGLLSFRETPAVLDALARLAEPADLVLCDAHGIAHPRRFGMASHVGVLLEVPTIGVAKSRYIGEHDEPGAGRGDWTPLRDRGEVVGAVVRTRARTRPLYVSVGHRVSLETAIAWVLRCAPRYRLPEPIREADRLSRAEPAQRGRR